MYGVWEGATDEPVCRGGVETQWRGGLVDTVSGERVGRMERVALAGTHRVCVVGIPWDLAVTGFLELVLHPTTSNHRVTAGNLPTRVLQGPVFWVTPRQNSILRLPRAPSPPVPQVNSVWSCFIYPAAWISHAGAGFWGCGVEERACDRMRKVTQILCLSKWSFWTPSGD